MSIIDTTSQPSHPQLTERPEYRAYRNTRKGPTTFCLEGKRAGTVWQGFGDPSGGDVKSVSREVYETPEFQDAIDAGVFVEVDRDQARLARSTAVQAKAAQQQQAIDDAMSYVDTSDNDLIMSACVGPGSRPGVFCGALMSVPASERNTKAPLCPNHEALASTFVLVREMQGNALVPIWRQMVAS